VVEATDADVADRPSPEAAAIAFEDFFHAEYRSVVRALVVVTSDETSAEELAQEAFARAFERWSKVRTMDSPAGYVYRTALNLNRSRLRRAAIAARISRAERPAQQEPDTTMRHEIRAMLRSLPRTQREALMLVEWLGYTTEEAAAILRVRPVSVRGRLHRAAVPSAAALEATMRDVRDLLEVAVGPAEPTDVDIGRVLRRARAHRRRQRLLAGALAIVLTAGLAAGLVVAVHRGGTTVPASGGIVGPTRLVEIPSTSMEPTLRPGDRVLVDEGAYRGRAPRRGDIVAFTLPEPDPDLVWVKRVIGLPGDTIGERHGTMYVNGRKVVLPSEGIAPDHHTLGPWVVPSGHLFVIGDYLANSNDSRFAVGYVPMHRVIGRVVQIISRGARPVGGGGAVAPTIPVPASGS
jgi:signal peptidase I